MKSKFLFISILLGCASALYGNGLRSRYYKHRITKDTSVVVAYIDSLRAYRVKTDSLQLQRYLAYGDTVSAARTFKLFAPLTFYYSVAENKLKLNGGNDGNTESFIDDALINVYIHHPEYVVSTEKELLKIGSLHEEITKPLRHKVEYVKPDFSDVDEKPDIPLEIVVNKPNFWTFNGDYYLQFLQNYVSGNWYKGGESNYSMVASATLQANYNNKQKVKFENKLEMKLGFQTSRGDTLHNFKTSEDLIRYTGKLGLQASKKWYYTLQLVAYTQFMRGYKSNDAKVYSDILSPLNTNLSLGMSYTVDAFSSRLKGSVQLAPFAYNFRYVSRRDLATRYGLDEGKHAMNDFGSECTVDLTWTFSDLIKWKTRLYGYTTYKRAEIEWENTISFQFNRYISSNIFVYPRFDDGSKRDAHHGYWQFKEYASIGFAYSF